MESDSDLLRTNTHFFETPDRKYMKVNVSLRASDWDNTIGVCIKCRFKEEEKFRRDNIEILCANSNRFKNMRQAQWCDYWVRT